ncbi:hypothetical protein ACRAWF_15160 [Streptomyces sp. L7]
MSGAPVAGSGRLLGQFEELPRGGGDEQRHGHRDEIGVAAVRQQEPDRHPPGRRRISRASADSPPSRRTARPRESAGPGDGPPW